MSITYLNPHADDFIAAPVSFHFAKRRALKKYSYLFQEPLKQGEKVHVLIDGTLSSLIPQKIFNRLPRSLRLSFLHWEIKQWRQLNDFPDNLVIHWKLDTVPNLRCLYLFSYKNCLYTPPERLRIVNAFRQKIINLSHFMIHTAEKARQCQKLDNVLYTSEACIENEPYFSNFFGQNQTILALPFMVQDRFKITKEWQSRKNTCAATGSFHDLSAERPVSYYRDFINFFNSKTYHPVREALYQQQGNLADYIDCRVSPYREKKRSLLQRLDASQKEYFSFDIVEFYNDHKYAVIGEELHGLPAIGAFEAMACGCVLIGQAGPYYTALGLRANHDYYEYDGTIEGLKAAIQFLNDTPDLAQQIAENGARYCQMQCRSPQLWETIHEKIQHYT